MPTQERLADFIATVVRGEHVEAIERFYAPHATMQENNAPPRVGRDVLVAHEAAALARLSRMETEPASGLSRPATMRKVVVLPAPLGPSRA